VSQRPDQHLRRHIILHFLYMLCIFLIIQQNLLIVGQVRVDPLHVNSSHLVLFLVVAFFQLMGRFATREEQLRFFHSFRRFSQLLLHEGVSR
jgi:hypothetical protein